MRASSRGRREGSVAGAVSRSRSSTLSHWSTLAEPDFDEDDEEVAEVSNVKVFKALQSHPT